MSEWGGLFGGTPKITSVESRLCNLDDVSSLVLINASFLRMGTNSFMSCLPFPAHYLSCTCFSQIILTICYIKLGNLPE